MKQTYLGYSMGINTPQTSPRRGVTCKRDTRSEEPKTFVLYLLSLLKGDT